MTLFKVGKISDLQNLAMIYKPKLSAKTDLFSWINNQITYLNTVYTKFIFFLCIKINLGWKGLSKRLYPRSSSGPYVYKYGPEDDPG
jgi:hypothetical protein